MDDHIQKWTFFEQGGPYPSFVTEILRAELFGATGTDDDYELFRLIKLGFDRFLANARSQMGIF
jgi:hypothetical protein